MKRKILQIIIGAFWNWLENPNKITEGTRNQKKRRETFHKMALLKFLIILKNTEETASNIFFSKKATHQREN